MNHQYFLEVAKLTAQLSKCCKRKVGAVLVVDNRTVATGYNGTPSGFPNCNEGGCARCNGPDAPGVGYHKCSCIHAEANCVYNAARFGAPVAGSTLYVTLQPCLQCLLMIVQVGIRSVFYIDTLQLVDTSYQYALTLDQAHKKGLEYGQWVG